MKSALPHLGTNAALTVMRDMILKDEMPQEEIKDWLFSIALTPLYKTFTFFHFALLTLIYFQT